MIIRTNGYTPIKRIDTPFPCKGQCTSDKPVQLITADIFKPRLITVTRRFDKHPFVPQGPELNERCEEIFAIQVAGLAKRLVHTSAKTVVVGISGGLDSTLALLVCVRTFDKLGWERKGIVGVTMPGFGTTDRTYTNALSLMSSLGVTIREVNIKDACIQHFEDIDHGSGADSRARAAATGRALHCRRPVPVQAGARALCPAVGDG